MGGQGNLYYGGKVIYIMGRCMNTAGFMSVKADLYAVFALRR